jgi:hypothetical protein
MCQPTNQSTNQPTMESHFGNNNNNNNVLFGGCGILATVAPPFHAKYTGIFYGRLGRQIH